jgi:hypothetical protein
MEIAVGAAAANVLLWIVQLLAVCCLASLLFLAFMTWRGRRRARVLRAAVDDPDHPLLRFPPYLGL